VTLLESGQSLRVHEKQESTYAEEQVEESETNEHNQDRGAGDETRNKERRDREGGIKRYLGSPEEVLSI
jgi:hypothetical protein